MTEIYDGRVFASRELASVQTKKKKNNLQSVTTEIKQSGKYAGASLTKTSGSKLYCCV